MKILAIIPARGGSKSIPKKNIVQLLGKPLIAYSIESAHAAKRIDRIIVSTDDEEIASVAKEYGAEVPFLRPVEIAGDTTPDLPVFQHALIKLKMDEDYSPDAIVHLWPTSPYRERGDIDKAIALLEETPTADSVRSVTTPSQVPFKMWRRGNDGFLEPIMKTEYKPLYEKEIPPHESPRQILPETLAQTGYLAVIRSEIILQKNSMMGNTILPFFHSPDTYTELDSIKDFAHTEYVLRLFS